MKCQLTKMELPTMASGMMLERMTQEEMAQAKLRRQNKLTDWEKELRSMSHAELVGELEDEYDFSYEEAGMVKAELLRRLIDQEN